ncbi:MAG: hypothetical protein GX442_22295 [Candidatus Riflebacteria bacterium]|nr:hypothetical protein [Candidatus Riflebacteria bacterium]
MPRIWWLAPNVVIMALIILFFAVFLGGLILTKILRPWLLPSKEEAQDPTFKNTRPVPLLICLTILYGPFLAGLWWAWNRPALLTIDQAGGWAFRNAYFQALFRVAPDRPRTLEALIQRVDYDHRGTFPRYLCTGDLWVETAAGERFVMNVPVFPDDENDQPVFFEGLGYTGIASWSTGPHGGAITPLHTFTASGPVLVGPLVAEEDPAVTH